MRDPGTPRRNPLFAPSGDDEPPAPPVTDAGAEDVDDEPPPEAPEAEPRREDPEPVTGGPLHDHSLGGGVGVCPLCTFGVFASSMRDASPEAMEHLLGAAHEFLMAAKVVLDAADRAVELQRTQLAAAAASRAAAREAASQQPPEPPPVKQPPPEDPRDPPSGSSGRVRRIHLA